MSWEVVFHDDFFDEFMEMPIPVRRTITKEAQKLEMFGHALGRPHVDTLEGSQHANMKELRFNAGDGVWRLAFAFDPERKAILLVAGDKSGVSQKKFYKKLINKADERFNEHLKELKGE